MIVGIDLGTTNSAVAAMTEDGPRLIPNALGELLTPSVVGFEADGHLLVGRPAQEFQASAPDYCAALFKRHMGSDWTFTAGEKSYSPEELSSLLLRALKQDAEAFLGREVARAVITVPAYFNDHQRKATIRAGQLAGLAVERIINEPTAAAIAYGLHEAAADKTVAVFDLGGGTFDVSVVDLFEGMIEVRASAGQSFLGGEDFTRAMAARILNARGIAYERAEVQSPLMVARLLHQCERAKCRLSVETSAEVRLPDDSGQIPPDAPAVAVTRDEFQQWTEALLRRIEMPMRRGLADAKLNAAMVDEVILVGGATRMPAVRQRVEQFFRQPPQWRMNPDEVVALGAAVQAGLIDHQAGLGDMVVTDVAPFTLGTQVAKKLGMEVRTGYFSPIIHRNTTIPVSRVERYSTLHPNQTKITIGIYQGEGRRVADNLLLGELEVTGIPCGPAGQAVDVRMTYDLNGILEVEATVVATGKKRAVVIARHAHGLTDDEVAAAVASMQSLKTHPREETPNRFLLRRAERLCGELPLEERAMLESLLDGFEEVLEMQDKTAIERTRSALEAFLRQFEDGPDDSYESTDDHDT